MDWWTPLNVETITSHNDCQNPYFSRKATRQLDRIFQSFGCKTQFYIEEHGLHNSWVDASPGHDVCQGEVEFIP
jgi:hypothetical protein